MRFIHIDKVQSGMKLAKPVYNENNGAILLKADVELTPFYIRKIKEMEYDYICIREKGDPDIIEKLDPIREETRGKSLKIVKEVMTKLAKNSVVMDTQRVYAMIDEIISQILLDPIVGLDLVQIRNLNNYIFMHSVNVSVISIMIGSLLRLSKNHLELLGTGAILHDIGNVAVDSQILNKPDKLSPEEFEIVKSHPKIGFDFLKARSSLSFLSAHVAYQHHERDDGSGYPRGLKGDKIHIFSKIAAVADTYDAMISPRSYRLAIPVQSALEKIREGTPQKFDPVVVAKLGQIIENASERST